jgi:hypothetical protein
VKFEVSQLRKKRYWLLPIICTSLAIFIVYYVAERDVEDLSLKIRTEDMAGAFLFQTCLA